MAQNILTKRNKPTIEHDGFIFVFEKLSKDGEIKFWRCQHFNAKDFKCHGRLHTEINGTVIRAIGAHSCSTSAENIGAQRVTTAIKKRAKETMEPPAVLRAATIENVPTPVLAQVPSKKSIRQIVKRARLADGEIRPAIPLTLDQLVMPPHHDFLSMNFINDHGDSAGTIVENNNFTPQHGYYVLQLPPQQPRDRLTYFSTFVDATIRDVNAQAPQVANQLMQSIYATIGNYLMHLPAQQQQHVEVEVPAITSDTTLPTTAAENIGVGEHIEIQYV